MTLQRRLLLILLLVGVPLIWAVSLVATIFHAREEIYELFDTEEVRLAQQVMAVLPLADNGAPLASPHGASARTGRTLLFRAGVCSWVCRIIAVG